MLRSAGLIVIYREGLVANREEGPGLTRFLAWGRSHTAKFDPHLNRPNPEPPRPRPLQRLTAGMQLRACALIVTQALETVCSRTVLLNAVYQHSNLPPSVGCSSLKPHAPERFEANRRAQGFNTSSALPSDTHQPAIIFLEFDQVSESDTNTAYHLAYACHEAALGCQPVPARLCRGAAGPNFRKTSA